MVSQIAKRQKEERLKTYKQHVLPNNNTPLHKKTRDAIKEVMCPIVDSFEHNHWKCVTGKCTNCPKYNIPLDEEANTEADNIRFHVYHLVTSCSKHGLLHLRTKVCKICGPKTPLTTQKVPKICTRKKLHLLEKPIASFMKDFYIPGLKKYASHQNYISMLSKHHCGKQRQEAFQENKHNVREVHDYAERCKAEFANKIQTKHFGNS